MIQKEQEEPRPKGPYGLWTAPAVEATKQAAELAEKSYNDIQKIKVPVMNFGEYVTLSLWHLWATGQPLDRESFTLSSSLDTDGYVLFGNWRDDGFRVNWYNRAVAHSNIRARKVVLPALR